MKLRKMVRKKRNGFVNLFNSYSHRIGRRRELSNVLNTIDYLGNIVGCDWEALFF